MAKKKGNWLQRARRRMERKGTVGSFTKYCGGKVTWECIERGLKSNDPKIRKRAAFAKAVRNMAYGGALDIDTIYMALGGCIDCVTNESLMAIDLAHKVLAYGGSTELAVGQALQTAAPVAGPYAPLVGLLGALAPIWGQKAAQIEQARAGLDVTKLAEGGSLEGYATAPQYKGAAHEEGGIPIDERGVPVKGDYRGEVKVEVEGGEVVYYGPSGRYVFSRRLKDGRKSFAARAKEIMEYYAKDKQKDPGKRAAFAAEMEQLRMRQEHKRKQVIEKVGKAMEMVAGESGQVMGASSNQGDIASPGQEPVQQAQGDEEFEGQAQQALMALSGISAQGESPVQMALGGYEEEALALFGGGKNPPKKKRGKSSGVMQVGYNVAGMPVYMPGGVQQQQQEEEKPGRKFSAKDAATGAAGLNMLVNALLIAGGYDKFAPIENKYTSDVRRLLTQRRPDHDQVRQEALSTYNRALAQLTGMRNANVRQAMSQNLAANMATALGRLNLDSQLRKIELDARLAQALSTLGAQAMQGEEQARQLNILSKSNWQSELSKWAAALTENAKYFADAETISRQGDLAMALLNAMGDTFQIDPEVVKAVMQGRSTDQSIIGMKEQGSAEDNRVLELVDYLLMKQGEAKARQEAAKEQE